MKPDSERIRTNFQNIYEVNYLFEVEWIEGCRTSTDSQSVESPVGDDDQTCDVVMDAAFSGCNNGGIGGYVDAGCLRYTFTGGLGSSD